MSSFRLVAAYSTVLAFIIYILIEGIHNEGSIGELSLTSSKNSERRILFHVSHSTKFIGKEFPDFSLYRQLDTLNENDFPIGTRRLILLSVVNMRRR